MLGRSKVGRTNGVDAELEWLGCTAGLPAEGVRCGAISRDAAEIVVVVQIQHRADGVRRAFGAVHDCGARERYAQHHPTTLSPKSLHRSAFVDREESIVQRKRQQRERRGDMGTEVASKTS